MSMRYATLLIVISLAFVGCKSKAPKIYDGFKKDTIVHSFKIYVKQPERYFLVSYTTKDKSSSQEIQGDLFFSHNGMFSKNDLDSMCYEGFDHPKSCYQDIVVVSMFEFKDSTDFNTFYRNHKNDELPKHKIICK